MKRIPFLKPSFPDISLIQKDLENIYKAGIYTNDGQFYKKFRSMIEEYLSQEIRISLVANATLGLMMAIKNLFIKGRNRALIQSFTFSAGAQAIIWAGYQPVFLDIEPASWQADLEHARAYLKKNKDAVAGIVACNTFGVPNRNIADWERLAGEHGLPLIIDSAAGFGSDYQDGMKMGARGDCEIFSFHATKPFAIGEGGAIASKDEKFIMTMERMKNFSFNDRRESTFIGLNAKLPEISCAIGTRVFEDFDNRLKIRRAILKKYKQRLDDNEIEFQQDDEFSAVPFFSILCSRRQKVIMNKMLSMGIQVRNYYNPPLHRQPLFSGFETVSDMVNTERVCNTIISLPMFEELSDADLDIICERLKCTLAEAAEAKTS